MPRRSLAAFARARDLDMADADTFRRQVVEGKRAQEVRRIYGTASVAGRIHALPCNNPDCFWHFGAGITKRGNEFSVEWSEN